MTGRIARCAALLRLVGALALVASTLIYAHGSVGAAGGTKTVAQARDDCGNDCTGTVGGDCGNDCTGNVAGDCGNDCTGNIAGDCGNDCTGNIGGACGNDCTGNVGGGTEAAPANPGKEQAPATVAIALPNTGAGTTLSGGTPPALLLLGLLALCAAGYGIRRRAAYG